MKTNLSPLKWLLAAGLLVLSAAGCGSRGSKQSLTDAALQRIDQISSEQQLELVELEIRKFLKAKDKGAWYQIGKKTIVLSCKAYLQAGIDLGDFNPMTDVVIDEERRSISLTLPCPTLLSMEMPLEEVEVADEKVTGFHSAFTGLSRQERTAGLADLRGMRKNMVLVDHILVNDRHDPGLHSLSPAHGVAHMEIDILTLALHKQQVAVYSSAAQFRAFF